MITNPTKSSRQRLTLGDALDPGLITSPQVGLLAGPFRRADYAESGRSSCCNPWLMSSINWAIRAFCCCSCCRLLLPNPAAFSTFAAQGFRIFGDIFKVDLRPVRQHLVVFVNLDAEVLFQ